MNLIPFELENCFDKGLAKSSDHELLKWISLLEFPDFKSFYFRGEELLQSDAFNNSRNFIIVWLILGAEAQYDMVRRQHYIETMNKIRFELFDPYLEFYTVYFQATKCFFDGDLVQARTLNDIAFKMATQIQFPRGQARSLFHQALTFFDMEQSSEGFHCLQECLIIARQNGFNRTIAKAEAEFHRQKNNPYLKTDPMENKIDIIKMHFEDRNIAGGRKALAQAEIYRRRIGFNKAKYSLTFYRASFLVLQKKPVGVRRTLRTMTDPVLISKIYDLMLEEELTLTAKEQTHHRILKLHLHQPGLNQEINFTYASLDPIFLKNIKNEDVRALIALLLESEEPLSKENIIHRLFNFKYDPTIHDQRLYKLILRTRKEINSDLIINHYGKYSLNIKKYKIVI